MMNKIIKKPFTSLIKRLKKDNPDSIKTLAPYKDSRGNEIIFEGRLKGKFDIQFKGRNNKLYIDKNAKTSKLKVQFDCDNAVCKLKENSFNGTIRLGEDCEVSLGKKITCNGSNILITTAEGSKVIIGDDCIISKNVEIRASDSHPIFDIKTGKRVNMCKSIIIEDHVWIAAGVTILGGAKIGEGSVLGSSSVVKGHFPNNCTIAGIPARVIRKDIAWERPHLSGATPPYKPDRDSITTTQYWNLTQELET